MDPTVWGPKLWFVIHTFALNYPDNPSYEDKRVMEEFFNNLKSTIPCQKCKIHYRQRLQQNPVISYLDNRQSIFKYTVDLHNQVNKSLGKKIYTYDEAVEIYKKAYDPNYVENREVGFFQKWFNWKYVCISAFGAIILTAIVVYLKKKYPKRVIKLN
tara:strand:+ start:1686 stop:2156 length:471 start_codon:yes stop_codon:yes gene_type:complete